MRSAMTTDVRTGKESAVVTPQSLATQLHVPADRRFLAMIQGHVRELAAVAGFKARDATALELATEEIFINICSHAYPGDVPGDVFLDGEINARALRLVFRDEGLPFDPALVKASGQTRVGDDPCPASLGLKLIRHAVDEAHWVNRGRLGKELRLLKWLPQAVEPLVAEQEGEIRQAAPTRYAIRLMEPGEALQVARIFWLAYGYSYKKEDFYRPEGLLRLVGGGKLISFVAVAEDGEVAAHAGLLRTGGEDMAEAALLVVSPAHRGRGLMKALSAAMTEKAKSLGLLGLSLNPVTSHPASQGEVIQSGGRPCGLDLAACPPRRFKAMRLEQVPTQRESYLHCFRYLSDPPPALVHAPARLMDMIERIYESLERPLTLGQPGEAVEAGESGEYRVSFDREMGKGTIRVTRADARQWPEINRAALDLSDIAQAAVVVLDLPLAQPATALVCEQAEAAGFFFAGVWPHEADDGDALRLIRLRAPIDLGLLRLCPGFASELGQYVGAQMERAAAIVGKKS